MRPEAITLKAWDEIHQHAKAGWIYRGQQNVEWPLQTSLERFCDRFAIRSAYRPQAEAEILREFRRTYFNYTRHPPSHSDGLEWLSIMQHHGAPTRLLDFSYSIYVAAYFALERADGDSVVWAVNAPWAYQETLTNATKIGKQEQTFPPEKLLPEDEARFFPFFVAEPFVLGACPLNPYRLNERLRLQKGIFMIPGDMRESFERNMSQLRRHDERANYLRIVIPKELQIDALQRLYYMNITRTSLFPGLDGYSESLGVFHPQLRNYQEQPLEMDTATT